MQIGLTWDKNLLERDDRCACSTCTGNAQFLQEVKFTTSSWICFLFFIAEWWYFSLSLMLWLSLPLWQTGSRMQCRMLPYIFNLCYRNLISLSAECSHGAGATSKILWDTGPVLGLLIHLLLNACGWVHLLNCQLLLTLNTNIIAEGIIHELTCHWFHMYCYLELDEGNSLMLHSNTYSVLLQLGKSGCWQRLSVLI